MPDTTIELPKAPEAEAGNQAEGSAPGVVLGHPYSEPGPEASTSPSEATTPVSESSSSPVEASTPTADVSAPATPDSGISTASAETSAPTSESISNPTASSEAPAASALDSVGTPESLSEAPEVKPSSSPEPTVSPSVDTASTTPEPVGGANAEPTADLSSVGKGMGTDGASNTPEPVPTLTSPDVSTAGVPGAETTSLIGGISSSTPAEAKSTGEGIVDKLRGLLHKGGGNPAATIDTSASSPSATLNPVSETPKV